MRGGRARGREGRCEALTCSALLTRISSFNPWISAPAADRSASRWRIDERCVPISARRLAICAICASLSAVSSSFSRISSVTVFSWPTDSPAPCSTRRERLEISVFSWPIVSLALASFSCEASTIFHAFSISRFRLAIVFWSSWLSLSAVCT